MTRDGEEAKATLLLESESLEIHRERKALRARSFLSELKFRPPTRRCLAAGRLQGMLHEERSFVAALLRMTAKNNGNYNGNYNGNCDNQRQKKKQVPHPSALRAYGLRMTRKTKE